MIRYLVSATRNKRMSYKCSKIVYEIISKGLRDWVHLDYYSRSHKELDSYIEKSVLKCDHSTLTELYKLVEADQSSQIFCQISESRFRCRFELLTGNFSFFAVSIEEVAIPYWF